MTLVCYDNIEGVYRDVQLDRIIIEFLIAGVKNRIATEEIDGHPLNGADIHEGVTRVWIGQVRPRQNFRIEFLLLVEVASLESLAIDLVDSVELQSRFRLEGSKCEHSLSGQSSTIH